MTTMMKTTTMKRKGKYIQLHRQNDNSWLMFDSSSSLFYVTFSFFASRASEDEFPRNDDEDRNDEESDKDSFDVETR